MSLVRRFENHTPVVELLRCVILWLFVARAVAEHWPEFMLASFEDGDTRAQMMVVDGFTNVELIRLDSGVVRIAPNRPHP